MKTSTLGLIALGLTLFIADLPPGGMFGSASLTPVSAAGVARRTTRRTIAATSVYVATLPPACTVVVIEGTTLHQCGTTYYQASGTQYVVVNVQ
jgi:hypothetical protein